MTKPMYCPMAFANPIAYDDKFLKCTPDCAWAVHEDNEYTCAVAELALCALSQADTDEGSVAAINSRPLKDGAE